MSGVPMVEEILHSGQQTGHVTGMYEGEAMIYITIRFRIRI